MMSTPELPADTPAGMGVVAVTFPPLGQVSLVPTSETTLTVILKVPSTEALGSWEASVWHSIDSNEWGEAQAHPLPADKIPLSLQQEPPSVISLYFSVKLVVAGTCSFTLKFRSEQYEPWQWIRDATGIGDGTIIVQKSPPASSPDDIGDVLKNLCPKWSVSRKESQAPRSQLWSLGANAAAAQGETSSQEVIPLGLPWGGFLKWFSLARVSQPWIGPVHGGTRFDLALDGVLCSFLSTKGQNLVILAVSGLRGVMTCLKSESGNVVVQVKNDSPTDEQATVLVSVGENFSQAVAAVMYHARDLVSVPGAQGRPSPRDLTASVADVQPQWRENWYDGLGYCTWNSLGQDLSDQKLFDALGKLAARNIHVSNLIIDDNWQSVEHAGEGMADRQWLEFEAERRNFPLGLKGTVGRIREKYPHIQHVAVWHALFGYWGGISPNGKIAKDYGTINVHRRYDLGEGHRPDGPMTAVTSDDVSRLYDDFYRFLSSCGVDGVKADAQCLLDALTSAPARKDLTRSYLDAWSVASLRHFGTNATSCMALVPQVIFRSLVPCNRPPFACRTSDDFQPGNEAAHGWHVWINAFNGILARHLNVVPDWDMFQTVGAFAGFHAAARCLSGGPVYITDVPGEHDLELIEEMTAMTTRGRTVILRPSVPAKAIDPYVSYHDDILLKIGGYNGSSQTGTPILGIFNVSSKPLTELLHLSTFPGAVEQGYIVSSHVSRTVSEPLDPNDPFALIPLSVDTRRYDILTAHPLTSIGGISAANLGLRGKMTGAVAIVSSAFTLTENNRVRLDASLKALGVLDLYISHLPSLSIADDFIATISGRVIPPSTVSISRSSEKILEIDVQEAWREVGAPVGWGNEVDVKVYFSLRK